MSKRGRLLKSIAEMIADYRQGEVVQRTPDLTEQWVQQFPAPTQDPLLEALAHVFEKTYISRDTFKTFLQFLASTDKLSPGSKPAEYWRSANILDIQQGGSSQKEILEMFDEVLQETHGFGLEDTGSKEGDSIYLDDCIGTGSRVRSDICAWLEDGAPKQSRLHVITPILYKGSWWIDGRIQQTAKAEGKTVNMSKWRLEGFEMENRKQHRNRSDVLWPTEIPDHPDVHAYVKSLEDAGYPVVLREAGNCGASGIFKEDAQKILLEQAFLTRGCQIRQEYDNLPDNVRPLGYHNLDTLGFGSMFVTYQNCPNNCPLVLWVEQDEYPALFPRKTNTQTAGENLLRGLLR